MIDRINHQHYKFLSKNICMIPNFLDEEVFAEINNIIKESKEEEWFDIRGTHRFHRPLSIPEHLSSRIRDKVRLTLMDNYDLKGFDGVSRLFPGDSMANHRDEAGRPAMYGFVIYLNDQFTGGELFYDKKNITYKPVPNSLVIHPTTEEFTHEVRTVNSGIRYTMIGFGYKPNTVLTGKRLPY